LLQLEGAEEVLTTDPEETRKPIVQARNLARASLEEARPFGHAARDIR
jgi:Histidine kinase